KIIVERPPTRFNVQELLLVEGIRVQKNIAVKFDVFVNLDDQLLNTPYVNKGREEYVGTFVELARGATDDKHSGCGQSSLCLEISEVLADLKVGDEKTIE
ncbi:hypothetical protein KI387_008727, partial [Taxus chinensis]